MFKILRLPAISRPLAWIMIFSFLTMTSGCYYFKVVRPTEQPRDVIAKMQEQQKLIILHLDDNAWQLTNIIVNDESITGSISVLAGHDRYKTVKPDNSNRYIKNKTQDESYILNEVHIFISEYSETDNGRISIPANAIKKIEIYDKDTGATTASWAFSALGVAAGAFGVLLVIIALTKSSCPFVYAYNGNDYLFSGEIFSGATQPGLERDDYMPLPGAASSEGAYSVRLTNEVHEIQSVNLARLLIVDHPADLSVLIDKTGKIQTYRQPSVPVTAENCAGKDILDRIGKKDSLNFSGNPQDVGKDGVETIIMKFVKPHDCESAKLLIRAKNSFWLDVLFTKFHMLFGERYNAFAEKQESASADKLNKFLLDQKIPLSVYVEKDGKWQPAGYFNIAGPMAMRDNILPVDLDEISSDTVKIKLETGFLFWEIDYAGMDFSKTAKVIQSELAVNNALDRNGSDVRDLLRAKDDSYLVLKEVGDEVVLDFNEPPLQNSVRSVFLHTSGYYKILRDQTGPADKQALKTFKKPNRFPEFSKEMYNLLTAR
jgi:hypothetical protein